MTVKECYGCGGELDIQDDQWYGYRWEEHPSKELVEKAIEDREFRDWFQENHIICPDCHGEIQSVVE